ncbi:MAG TPA: phospholipase D-like domain-containing protein [Thermomicrobiales bacterium]|nr:phospholipase D-like domain-containing protein [Thermomicrobiales bacterium]
MTEPQQETSHRRWPRWPIAILVVALLVAAGATLWLRQSSTLPLAPTSVAGPPLTATGVFIEPGDGRAPLLDEIQAAQHSIDLAVYIVTDDVILQALEDAQRRGVAVRVILEEHPFGGGGGQEEIFARLEGAGIAVAGETRSSASRTSSC